MANPLDSILNNKGDQNNPLDEILKKSQNDSFKFGPISVDPELVRFGKGAVNEALRLGKSAGNALSNLAPPMLPASLRQNAPNIQNASPLAVGNKDFAYKAGQFVPYLLSGLTGTGEGAAVSPLERLAVRSAESGSIGGLANPEHPVIGGLLGAAASPVAEVAAQPIEKGAQLLGRTLAKAFPGLGESGAGAITKEEFERNLAAQPAGIKLPLGDVANSPALKKAQSALNIVPFSGGDKPIQQLGEFLNGGINRLESRLPENEPDLNRYAFDKYTNAYENAKARTADAYNALGQAANAVTKKVNPVEFSGRLNDLIGDLKDKAKASDAFNAPLKALESFKPDLSSSISGASGVSFKNALSLRQKITELQSNFLGKDKEDRIMRSYLARAKDALDDDINRTADQSGNPEIRQLAQEARQARIDQANQFEKLPNGKPSPFFKIYNEFGNDDTGNFINQYLKESKSGRDNSALAQKLLGPLDNETRHAIGSSFLSFKDTLPQKLSRLKNLSDNQKELMFGENAPLAKNISEITRLFPEGKNVSLIPKTGYTGAKSALGGGLGTSGAIGILGGNPAAVGAAIGVPLAARAASGILRSNTLKKIYGKGLLKEISNVEDKRLQENLIRALELGALNQTVPHETQQ